MGIFKQSIWQFCDKCYIKPLLTAEVENPSSYCGTLKVSAMSSRSLRQRQPGQKEADFPLDFTFWTCSKDQRLQSFWGATGVCVRQNVMWRLISSPICRCWLDLFQNKQGEGGVGHRQPPRSVLQREGGTDGLQLWETPLDSKAIKGKDLSFQNGNDFPVPQQSLNTRYPQTAQENPPPSGNNRKKACTFSDRPVLWSQLSLCTATAQPGTPSQATAGHACWGGPKSRGPAGPGRKLHVLSPERLVKGLWLLVLNTECSQDSSIHLQFQSERHVLEQCNPRSRFPTSGSMAVPVTNPSSPAGCSPWVSIFPKSHHINFYTPNAVPD